MATRLDHLYARSKARLGLSRKKRLPVRERDLFPSDLIAHFSYHKCLTYYYQRIMLALHREFGFHFSSCGSKSHLFNAQALHHRGKRILTLSDSDGIEWDRLPSYRGSHFIRDPRDLIVSGYHYHLWTKEEWSRTPNFGWQYFIDMPEFQYVETDPARFPTNESYQEYLNKLNPESGMILEMLWRKPHFEQMQRWNFDNPNILELRYENIVGSERDAFAQLFAHYGFHPRLRDRGLEIVEGFSIKNQPQGKGTHLRSGESRQWEQEFTPLASQVFKQKYNNVLIHLGYAKNLNW